MPDGDRISGFRRHKKGAPFRAPFFTDSHAWAARLRRRRRRRWRRRIWRLLLARTTAIIRLFLVELRFGVSLFALLARDGFGALTSIAVVPVARDLARQLAVSQP